VVRHIARQRDLLKLDAIRGRIHRRRALKLGDPFSGLFDLSRVALSLDLKSFLLSIIPRAFHAPFDGFKTSLATNKVALCGSQRSFELPSYTLLAPGKRQLSHVLAPGRHRKRKEVSAIWTYALLTHTAPHEDNINVEFGLTPRFQVTLSNGKQRDSHIHRPHILERRLRRFQGIQQITALYPSKGDR